MNPVLLITGGSRGIGAATALLAARRGYAVAVNYSANEKAADDVIQQIHASGGRAFSFQGNVAVEAQVMAMFETIDTQLGRLTALVNNAGVVDVAQRVDEMSAARLKRMSTRHGGTGGAIVNVSSVAARLGGAGQYVDYAASKGAIDSFTMGLAKEVALEGIRVNAVRPGIIETDIHASGGQPDRARQMAPVVPLQRAGSALEVAQAILWLLSDESSYTTGTLLDVAGGR